MKSAEIVSLRRKLLAHSDPRIKQLGLKLPNSVIVVIVSSLEDLLKDENDE